MSQSQMSAGKGTGCAAVEGEGVRVDGGGEGGVGWREGAERRV